MNAQAAKVLRLLKEDIPYQRKPTLYFREHKIMSPASRIIELRAMGYDIQTVDNPDSAGDAYLLIREASHAT